MRMAESFSPIAWHAPTHEYTHRSADWYWALGVLAIAGVVLSIFLGNLLFALVIALSCFSIGYLALKEPRDCEVEVSDRGVRIDTNLYPYRSLKSFAIDDESRERPQLIVMTSSLLHPELVLPLGDHVDPEELREILSLKLPQEDHYESVLARFADFLGF